MPYSCVCQKFQFLQGNYMYSQIDWKFEQNDRHNHTWLLYLFSNNAKKVFLVLHGIKCSTLIATG